MHHFLQRLGNLINVALVFGMIAHVRIGCGNLCFTIADGCCFGGQGIPGPGRGQFGNGAHIPCMQFRYLKGLISL